MARRHSEIFWFVSRVRCGEDPGLSLLGLLRLLARRRSSRNLPFRILKNMSWRLEINTLEFGLMADSWKRPQVVGFRLNLPHHTRRRTSSIFVSSNPATYFMLPIHFIDPSK